MFFYLVLLQCTNVYKVLVRSFVVTLVISSNGEVKWQYAEIGQHT